MVHQRINGVVPGTKPYLRASRFRVHGIGTRSERALSPAPPQHARGEAHGWGRDPGRASHERGALLFVPRPPSRRLRLARGVPRHLGDGASKQRPTTRLPGGRESVVAPHIARGFVQYRGVGLGDEHDLTSAKALQCYEFSTS